MRAIFGVTIRTAPAPGSSDAVFAANLRDAVPILKLLRTLLSSVYTFDPDSSRGHEYQIRKIITAYNHFFFAHTVFEIIRTQDDGLTTHQVCTMVRVNTNWILDGFFSPDQIIQYGLVNYMTLVHHVPPTGLGLNSMRMVT